jgi:hypothetical protein
VKPLASLAGNFAHLKSYDEQLLRLGLLGKRYFTEDPNTSLLKLRQLAELLAKHVATRIGLFVSAVEPQYELIRRLQHQGILTHEIAQLFGEVRRAGNAASHALAGDHRNALATLKTTWQLGVWFHTVASRIPLPGVVCSSPRRHLPTTSTNFAPNWIVGTGNSRLIRKPTVRPHSSYSQWTTSFYKVSTSIFCPSASLPQA